MEKPTNFKDQQHLVNPQMFIKKNFVIQQRLKTADASWRPANRKFIMPEQHIKVKKPERPNNSTLSHYSEEPTVLLKEKVIKNC